MYHPLQHISDLSEICHKAGYAHIVISPGSRNAPLIDAFVRLFGDQCHSLVDERSAAYFALGLARECKKPVALVCTSGTAVLNYAPAVAEAFYQQIPLLIITADRPAEWIDQQDNQTIRQKKIYQNYSKSGYVLPERVSDPEHLKAAHEIMLLAIREVCSAPMGPVHLNIPLHEPLYDELPLISNVLPFLDLSGTEDADLQLPAAFIEGWKNAENILIIHGQDLPGIGKANMLAGLEQDGRIVLLAENISNQAAASLISEPELFFAHADIGSLPVPDLIIYSGGQLVSKRTKTFLRGLSVPAVWRVGIDHFEMDTFRQKNQYLKLNISDLYKGLSGRLSNRPSNPYKQAWLKAYEDIRSVNKKRLKHLAFSDLSVIRDILKDAPEGTRMELGNSSTIRYAQMIPLRTDLYYYSNRGVSGIDGCLSAAAGTASECQELCYSILGDLSFVYDSNALWNRNLPPNLRIFVLNNRGGGIFDLIDGPGKKTAYEEFFLAYHPVDLQKLAEAFNLKYFCARDEDELQNILPELRNKQDVAVIVEALTDREQNTTAFKSLMRKNGK